MGGVLPFGCIFIQLFFILNSLWSNQMYYMFGFLFLVFIILVITCSETTVLLCYFHLCAEVCLNFECSKNVSKSKFSLIYRTITGGGAVFWQAGLQPFTCSFIASTISSQNWKFKMPHPLSFTLDTLSSWFSCSSFFPVKFFFFYLTC